MFCLYILPLARPAQMLTTSNRIVTILLKCFLKSLGLYQIISEKIQGDEQHYAVFHLTFWMITASLSSSKQTVMCVYIHIHMYIVHIYSSICVVLYYMSKGRKILCTEYYEQHSEIDFRTHIGNWPSIYDVVIF